MKKRRVFLVTCLILVDLLGEGTSWRSCPVFHAWSISTTRHEVRSTIPQSSHLLRRMLRLRSDAAAGRASRKTALVFSRGNLRWSRATPFVYTPLLFTRRDEWYSATSLKATPARRLPLGKLLTRISLHHLSNRGNMRVRQRDQCCFGVASVEDHLSNRGNMRVRQRDQCCFGVASVEGEEDRAGVGGEFSIAPKQDVTSTRTAGGFLRQDIPKWKHKAVIIPGFATDARTFEQLCYRLERRGIASVVVPIRWYHWLPTLGGRSVRPILDRIHETVIRCVAADSRKEMPYAFNKPGLQSMVAPYSTQDFLAEMIDPRNGAHHMGPLNLPRVPPQPSVDDRVVLIAHSAGGWMSRIYLSEASYDGRVYNGSRLVNGMVTLGTPHVCLEDSQGRPRELPFSRNFKFVEEFCSGQEGGEWEETTPTACVGGAALRGRSIFGGLLKDLVYQSYELCCGDGTGMGDGITPLQSAFDMTGAKRFIQLDGVYHSAGLGGPWYGSDNVIDSWLEPSLETIFGSSNQGEGKGGPATGIVQSEDSFESFGSGVAPDGQGE